MGESMKKLNVLTRIRKRFKDKKGQSTTEYILILAIVVMMAGKVRTLLTQKVTGSLNVIDSSLSEFQQQQN